MSNTADAISKSMRIRSRAVKRNLVDVDRLGVLLDGAGGHAPLVLPDIDEAVGRLDVGDQREEDLLGLLVRPEELALLPRARETELVAAPCPVVGRHVVGAVVDQPAHS